MQSTLVRRVLIIPSLALCVWLGRVEDAAAQKSDFDSQIAPLFVQRCLDCHSGPSPKGDFDLSSQKRFLAGGELGPVVVPGKPEESLLWQYVDQDKMPPKKPLAARDKAAIRAWIEAGAKWGTDPIDPYRVTTEKRAGLDWWALQPLSRPNVPPVDSHFEIQNPIDAFVAVRLKAAGLSFSPSADRLALIRRVAFDLTGLPPSPAEVALFIRDDSPDAYEKLVSRLLDSPAHGVRWARHWLDVVRFGESNGFEHDEFRPNAWPYRDWVVHALNNDLPYDEFARLQLAGDLFRPADPNVLAATGFLVAGSYDSVGQTQQSEAMRKVVRQDEMEDIVGTVGQTFLGLTVQCARCHDHKFDPVKQVEYYRLAASLGGVRHGERPCPAPEKERTETERKLESVKSEIEALEAPWLRAFLGGHDRPAAVTLRPIARWDFSKNLNDLESTLDVTMHNGARLTSTGLEFDGRTGYAMSAPLKMDLKAKTLEAWVSLENLDQSGGGIIGVQRGAGSVFDSLVYGEREPGQWLAGSESFKRTQSFQGPKENVDSRKIVHLAVAYSSDGTITAYRDGKRYGKPHMSNGPAVFEAGKSRIIFGMRHSPPGGNRMFAGSIRAASLYDRALNAAEIAASAQAGIDYLPTAVLLTHLGPRSAAHWRKLVGELKELERKLDPDSHRIYAVVPREPEPMYVLAGGNPAQPGELARAGGVAAVSGRGADFGLPPEALESLRRRTLTDWITSDKNPLFARVIVNRLWHYHFGTGLVETPNDFGFNGGRPSHPELLDWLAEQLIQHAWSLKYLQRLIVTSATYRQASSYNRKAVHRDADNRLLWRKSPTRLEAETVRDAALSVSGLLNERMGGPGFQEFRLQPATGTTTNTYLAADRTGNEFNRRTLYRAWARGGRNKLLDTLDCPDPSTTSPRRAITTTPQQALALMNNALMLRLAKQFADRVAHEAGPNVNEQIILAYQLAYGRAPTAEEIALVREFLKGNSLEVLTRAIFNSNELLYVD